MKNDNKQMIGWYKEHKDASPVETISKVRAILSEKLELIPIENDTTLDSGCFYSSRITIDGNYTVGANGKGISHEYSLASGYAEFMERLQNLSLLRSKFGLMKEFSLTTPDSKKIKLEDVIETNKYFFKHTLLGDLDKSKYLHSDMECNCIPYYNVREKRVSYLPEFLGAFTGSNGMCAGNTAEEAISQGICEILERYAIRRMWSENAGLPTIALHEVKHLSIYKDIEVLVQKGFKVIIKDASFGGIFPVVGVIVFKNDYSKCIVNFGADLCFEVALMRSLTEAFQGFETIYEGKMYKYNLLDDKSSILTKYGIDDYQISCCLTKLFFSSGNSMHHNAFINHFHNSKHSMNFLIEKVLSLNTDIYIRDSSFLGFPSFQIYIPGYSEFHDLELAESIVAIQPALSILMRLPIANTAELLLCIDLLEEYLRSPFSQFVHNVDFGQFIGSHIPIVAQSDLNNSIHYFMFLMSVKVRNYSKALEYVDRYLKSLKVLNLKLVNADYYFGIMCFLKLKKEGDRNTDQVKFSLETILGIELADKIISDLENTEKIFDKLLLPTCGDCSCCAIKETCMYENWLFIQKKIQKIINESPINQMNLRDIVNLS